MFLKINIPYKFHEEYNIGKNSMPQNVSICRSKHVDYAEV